MGRGRVDRSGPTGDPPGGPCLSAPHRFAALGREGRVVWWLNIVGDLPFRSSAPAGPLVCGGLVMPRTADRAPRSTDVPSAHQYPDNSPLERREATVRRASWVVEPPSKASSPSNGRLIWAGSIQTESSWTLTGAEELALRDGLTTPTALARRRFNSASFAFAVHGPETEGPALLTALSSHRRIGPCSSCSSSSTSSRCSSPSRCCSRRTSSSIGP